MRMCIMVETKEHEGKGRYEKKMLPLNGSPTPGTNLITVFDI